MSSGGINKCTVDVRLICRKAIELGATNVGIGHNHPSGIIQPSSADFNTTNKLRDALDMFDITLIDHVIVGHGGCTLSLMVSQFICSTNVHS